ncbi:MAG: trypsin-like peptidase domain-containing protein [Microbacterium sp.]
MTDRAFVIGLDAYDHQPGWELRAAVRDALAFAKWVTAPGAGRATDEKLTLVRSPHPDRPVDDMEFQPATEKAIRSAMFEHTRNGADAKRLWFFYAGHGLAPAGGGPDEAPVIVPADVEYLDLYRRSPIDLGSWIREMQVSSPEHQVYFVDACRGIVVNEDVVTATSTLFFDLSKLQAGGQARQAVLFATTAGQLANEQGLHGLFGGALIEGLQGTGPVLVPDVETQEFVLTFGALSAYTKRLIQEQTEEARRAGKTFPTQEPAESLFRAQSSLELARFTEKPSAVAVRVFVDPEEATAVGTAGIRSYDAFTQAWARQAERPSPLGVPVEWKLPSTVYRIEIEAQGFENWAKTVEVIGRPVELHADLVQMPRLPVVRGLERGGLEGLDAFARAHERSASPDGAELAVGRRGTLVVRGRDRYARIEVFDIDGKRVEAAWQQLEAELPVGPYRVEIALPTERPVVQTVLVTADEQEEIPVHPDPQLTQRLPASAGMIYPQGGMSEPSEAFGTTTTTHLGSVLAWAASAAQFDAAGHGQRLREIGVEPLPRVPDGCFVRVLVGDALASEPNPLGGPLERLLLEMNQQPAVLQPVPALVEFATQWHAPVAFHTSLTLQADGLNPRRIPLPFIAGHVWTIVVVRESAQRTEIHRYLERLQPQQWFDDTIRLVEQSWRALEARTPLYEGEAELLLARDLDPLSLSVLGYRLALENRGSEVGDIVTRLGDVALADRHVLAALVGDRDQNMERAVKSPSVPVVGEGYRLMEAWLTDEFAKQNMPPPVAPEPLIGGLWTAFDTRAQAVISKAFPVRNAPEWATPLLPAAEATARVESGPSSPVEFMGTGFLVGPRALALADFLARDNPTVAVFGDERVVIEEILEMTDDDRHGALARITPTARSPVKIRWELPEVGTRIAVIGHPMITFTATIATLAAFTTFPTGEKVIMPGLITAVEEDKLTYECWTMAGVAGGPIVDLATGEVIGIHHSGRYEGGAKKLGFGVPVTAIEALLRTPV